MLITFEEKSRVDMTKWALAGVVGSTVQDRVQYGKKRVGVASALFIPCLTVQRSIGSDRLG